MSSTRTLWTLERIEEMRRNGIEESLFLDYKAAGALDRANSKIGIELTKDISAFANSGGGVLIYGVSEDSANRHLPGALNPLLRASAPKEWLESIVLTIQPRIEGIEIHPIPVGNDHLLYVIDVPKSTTAHQARDHRYYKRWNFSAHPMVDYEVRDVMNRRSHADVAITACFTVFHQASKDGLTGELFFKITNSSDVFAREVALIVHAPLRVRGKLIAYEKGVLMDVEGGHASKLLYSNRNDAPLFPRGTLHEFFKFRFAQSLVRPPETEINEFRWMVFADSMPMRSGKFAIDEIYNKQEQLGS